MAFLQNIVFAIALAITSLIGQPYGPTSIDEIPSPPSLNSLVAARSASEVPAATATSAVAKGVSAFGEPAVNTPRQNVEAQSAVSVPAQEALTAEQPDCAIGSAVIDLQGHPTITTKTATHVYTPWWDSGPPDVQANVCGTYTLVGADPSTFIALDQYYAKDASHVWIIQNPWSGVEGGADTLQIVGADPTTFALIRNPFPPGAWPDDPSEGFSYSYTEDKNHVYFYGQIVVGADPVTFVVDSISVLRSGTTCQFYDAQDATHYFDKGHAFVPQAPQGNYSCPPNP